MNLKEKRPAESEVIMAEVMQPTHANPAGNVHGGEIMKLMDNAAGAVAFRHARSNSVTVSVQDIFFKEPIYVGNLVQTHARLLYVGKSSMLVGVKMYVEDMLLGEHKEAIRAFFTMVALDKGNKSKEVPRLLLDNEKDVENFKIGKAKYEESKSRLIGDWLL